MTRGIGELDDKAKERQEPDVSFTLSVTYRGGKEFDIRSYITESSPGTYKQLVDQVFELMRLQFDEGDYGP